MTVALVVVSLIALASLAVLVAKMLGVCNFILKCTLGVMAMMWLRWTLPRLRIDQVITTCLKYCVPLAAAMFLGAMLWTYMIPGGLGLMPGSPAAVAAAGEKGGP